MAKKEDTKLEAKTEQEAEAKTKAEAKTEEEAKAKAEDKAKAEVEAKKEKLVSIEEWAGVLRVASWQAAAVARHMGWDAGKKVTEKQYKDALASLNNRRIGG